MEQKKCNGGKKDEVFYFRGTEIETASQCLGESQASRGDIRHNANRYPEGKYRIRRAAVSAGTLTLRGRMMGKLLKLIRKQNSWKQRKESV